MIVMKEFDNAWEALEHEAHLVANHYRAYGAPELQGMANAGLGDASNKIAYSMTPVIGG